MGLLAISFLTTLPVPAQAWDVMGGVSSGVPTIDADSSPPGPDSRDPSSSSSPIIGSTHKIDVSPSSPTVISNPHGIDVTPDKPGLGKPGGTIKVGTATQPGVRLQADCSVAGTPVEFPDDIVITNAGHEDIPAGTKIAWRTTSPTIAGTVLVSKTLRVGRSASLSGVLSGGVPADTPCNVTAIGG